MGRIVGQFLGAILGKLMRRRLGGRPPLPIKRQTKAFLTRPIGKTSTGAARPQDRRIGTSFGASLRHILSRRVGASRIAITRACLLALARPSIKGGEVIPAKSARIAMVIIAFAIAVGVTLMIVVAGTAVHAAKSRHG